MLVATVFTPDGAETLDDVSAISDALAKDDTLVWVDVYDLSEGDKACIQEEFGLHQVAVDALDDRGQRPRLNIFDDHAFLVAFAPGKSPGDLPKVSAIIGRNWLITARLPCGAGDVWDPTAARARYERAREGDVGPGFLLYIVLDEIVDGFFDIADDMEDAIETVGDNLFNEEAMVNYVGSSTVEEGLLHVRHQLIGLRRRLVPLRDVVLSILRKEVQWIDDKALVYYQDILDHLLRVIDQIDGERELLGSVVDAHLGLQANAMNQVMKRMTSWGAILIVATLIAGIYGMNFHDMPELSWRYGYPGALGTMAFLTLSMYLWFKKRGWL